MRLSVATVGIAAPLQRAVTQWDDYVGRFAPSQTVDIRPRVSGAVTAIHFQDGDYVRKGQLLFTIDQRPFRAALAEARASVASVCNAVAIGIHVVVEARTHIATIGHPVAIAITKQD